MKQRQRGQREKKSIFRSLFIPLFLIMILQAAIFYFAAMYGGISESLSKNAADILSGRLHYRRSELETQFNSNWADLDVCELSLERLYAGYESAHGDQPLLDSELQVRFLGESADILIDTLRQNEVNGVFLILNDRPGQSEFSSGGSEQKYGLCIRDMDQESNYSGTEDLLLERSPSAIIDQLGCSLDSWWEAKYSFSSAEEGDFFYRPLEAAWENPGAEGGSLAYLSGMHQISGSDQAVLSYSIPLIDKSGYPYGVLGVELTASYLAAQLPNRELGDANQSCYVLCMRHAGSNDCVPLVGSGTLYTRCFDTGAVISCADVTDTGGFSATGRGGIALYGDITELKIYDNNNPFEDRQLTLLALMDSKTMFAYIDHIKVTLLTVSALSLALALVGITLASRRFAKPITALAQRVRGIKPQSGFELERIGVTEIDQLVDSIEELNRNVSKNSARTEFFSRMSHDMRTPMNAIISFSSGEMLEGADEAQKDSYLEKIHSSGIYLLGLINEVLDMTKIESNKTELHPEALRAASLCETSIPIIEKLAREKGVDFRCDISAPDDQYVIADGQHINQIVMNLLSNAVKFTPRDGTVRLSLSITDDVSNPELVKCRIVVTDTGIGMSEEFMRHLYTPFEQESRNLSREGTGLGLSIAKKLVELMGGSIECISRQNTGTTFTVSLSLPKSTAETATAVSSEKQLSVDAAFEVLNGKHILVCEDLPLNVLIISNLLQKAGISVETAVNGQECVELFGASPAGAFDAILMDIQMPVMNGLEATRAIRALDKADAATVPIIAMTANAFAEDVQASKTAGMNAHLAKPIDTQKLYSTLAQFLVKG